MPAQLVGFTDGLRILLDKPIMLLGREPECDIQFDSRKISRRHCCIAQVGERLIVRDLGSTNGVRINGVRVAEGYLKSGDELTIGNLRYQVTWGEIAAIPRRPAPRPKPEPPPLPVASVVDDEALESFDEPVPLPEPGKAPSNGSRPRAAPPPPPIIPEGLRLASSGDSPPPIPPVL